MPRRNHRPVRQQQKRTAPGEALPRHLRSASREPAPLDKMVLPKGRCFFRSRFGKLSFATEADAKRALEQAQAKRALHPSSAHVETRFYACPPGGCGGFHLTSREQYEPRSKP